MAAVKTVRNTVRPALVKKEAVKVAKVTQEVKEVPIRIGMKEITNAIVARHPVLARPTVDKVVQSAIEVISKNFAEGKVVDIKDFGKLMLHTRAPRLARNPKTGESIKVPSKTVPKFKFAKKLRELAA